MHDVIVVGVDGSPAGVAAAVWAAREAAARDLALKLVHVSYHPPLTDPVAEVDVHALAQTALAQAGEEIRATGLPVRVQTEVRTGNPLTTLIELSRTAALTCVGSIGLGCACHHAGSTAAALAGAAASPVAVIRSAEAGGPAGWIAAEVGAHPGDWARNRIVLDWAVAEAALHRAPLRMVAATLGPDLHARIDRWVQDHPGVQVQTAAVGDDIGDYIVTNAADIQLFVTGTRDRRSLGWSADGPACSVLTVNGPRR